MKSHVQTHPLGNTIPDPRDRTVNDPAVLVEAKYVRAFYANHNHSMEWDKTITQEEVFNFYRAQAEVCGWKVERMGNGALLSVAVQLDIVVVPQSA